jgi:hypothetical protein
MADHILVERVADVAEARNSLKHCVETSNTPMTCLCVPDDLRLLLTDHARLAAERGDVESLKKALKGIRVGLKHLMEALDIDPEDTRIDIKGAGGVVASVTFAELCSRADAALSATS